MNPQLLLFPSSSLGSHAEGLAAAARACYVRVVEHELTRQLGFCIVHLCSQYRHLSFLVYQHCGPILKEEIVYDSQFLSSMLSHGYHLLHDLVELFLLLSICEGVAHTIAASLLYSNLKSSFRLFRLLNGNITDFLIP